MNTALKQLIADASARAIDGWPVPLDLELLAKREPEAPKFIVADWVPIGYATLLAGHGGVGKSAIALCLSVCIAQGKPWYGLTTERRNVLYLSCEDREAVLHWRLSRICRHLGVDLSSLRDRLQILDLVGSNSLLFDRDPRTGNVLTAGYAALNERMREYGTELLVVDGVSDVFSGNENARAEVKRFANSLLALVPATGAVLFIGHVNRTSAINPDAGEGYSGSTQWHNAVRSRWFLYPETAQGEDGERTQRTGDLILRVEKGNQGGEGQSMRFRWDAEAHLFVGAQNGASHFDRRVQDRDEQDGIRHALKACADAGLYVPSAMTGPRSGYLVLSQRPEFPISLKGGGRVKTRRFWRQIEALRHMRHVAEGSIERKHRKHTATLTLTAEGSAACA